MALARRAEKATGRVLEVLVRWLAYAGGAVLAAMAVMTVSSITGRALIGFGLGPVPGDFELVEMASAIAVFSFLPWCHFNRGHVTVDILVDRFPTRVRLFLTVIGEITVAVVAWLVLWRHFVGFGERLPYGSRELRDALGFGMKPFFPETTFILGLPMWYGYALSLVGATLFFVVALYAIWRAVNAFLSGEEEIVA